MEKTRKQNGEGSVFQVAENKWVAKISMGTRLDGKPNIKQFSGKTEAIVKKKLKEFKKSRDFAEKHAPTNETVCCYFEKWLKDIQFNRLKPSSYDRLENTVYKNIIPNIGGMKLDKVTRENVQSLINKLYKVQGLSYSSVKKVYVALNSCFKQAMIDDVVIKNPCIGVVLPNQNETTKQIIAFTNEECEALINEITKTDKDGNDAYYYGYAYLLILNTGLRMGEALSLLWEDVDFENKRIIIRKNSLLTKKRDEDGNSIGGYELKIQNSLKTSSGNRVVPINKTAELALLHLRRNNCTEYVISNVRQHNVLPSNFDRTFHTILKNANIEKCGVHVLRHTFATKLFAKGVDVKIVSRLLGHSTVKITYDTYVHLFDEDIQQVTAVLD